MKLKQIIDETFGDYRHAAMLLVTPECTGKCSNCQNVHLTKLETQNFPDEDIWKRFEQNPITTTIVMGGLEPFIFIDDVIDFIKCGTNRSQNTTLVIYTGYEINEVPLKSSGFIKAAQDYLGTIIVKFGRYIPNQPSIYNKHLGVTLASDNQYAIIF